MNQLSPEEIKRRTQALQERLSRLRPVWETTNRELFHGADGSYIIRGRHSNEEVFYLRISPQGRASNLLGGYIDTVQYATILNCLQQAGLRSLSDAVGREYLGARRR